MLTKETLKEKLKRLTNTNKIGIEEEYSLQENDDPDWLITIIKWEYNIYISVFNETKPQDEDDIEIEKCDLQIYREKLNIVDLDGSFLSVFKEVIKYCQLIDEGKHLSSQILYDLKEQFSYIIKQLNHSGYAGDFFENHAIRELSRKVIEEEEIFSNKKITDFNNLERILTNFFYLGQLSSYENND